MLFVSTDFESENFKHTFTFLGTLHFLLGDAEPFTIINVQLHLMIYMRDDPRGLNPYQRAFGTYAVERLTAVISSMLFALYDARALALANCI